MAIQPVGRPVRIDAWVWSVRMFKTRSEAATAVRAGHVKLNGNATKPAQQVVPGAVSYTHLTLPTKA